MRRNLILVQPLQIDWGILNLVFCLRTQAVHNREQIASWKLASLGCPQVI